VRVSVTQLIRHSIACEVCRSRKKRCSGVLPCTFCSSHNIACSFSPPSRRKGVSKKATSSIQTHGVLSTFHSVNPLELTIYNESERSFFLHMFSDYDSRLLLTKTQILDLVQPSTPSEKMLSLCILGWMSRSCGYAVKSAQCMSEARSWVGATVDEFSPTAAVGYFLMAGFYPIADPRCLHFASIAWGLARQLRGKSNDIQMLKNLTSSLVTFCDFTLSSTEKQHRLMQNFNNFPATTHTEKVIEILSRIVWRLIPNMYEIGFPEVLLTFKDAPISSQTCAEILEEIETLINLLHENALSSLHTACVLFFCGVFKVYALWWSNNIKEAIEEAVALADSWVNVKFLVKCEDIYFIMLLVIFLNHVGYHDKACDLYNFFKLLCELSGQQEMIAKFPPPSPTPSSPINELALPSTDFPFSPIDDIAETSLPLTDTSLEFLSTEHSNAL